MAKVQQERHGGANSNPLPAIIKAVISHSQEKSQLPSSGCFTSPHSEPEEHASLLSKALQCAGTHLSSAFQLLQHQPCALVALLGTASAHAGGSSLPSAAATLAFRRAPLHICINGQELWCSDGAVVSCFQASDGAFVGNHAFPGAIKQLHAAAPAGKGGVYVRHSSLECGDAMHNLTCVQRQSCKSLGVAEFGTVPSSASRVLSTPSGDTPCTLLFQPAEATVNAGKHGQIILQTITEANEQVLKYDFRSADESFLDLEWLSMNNVLVLVQGTGSRPATHMVHLARQETDTCFQVHQIYRNIPPLLRFVPGSLTQLTATGVEVFAADRTAVFRLAWAQSMFEPKVHCEEDQILRPLAFSVRQVGQYKDIPTCDGLHFGAFVTKSVAILKLETSYQHIQPKQSTKGVLELDPLQFNSQDVLPADLDRLWKHEACEISVLQLLKRMDYITRIEQPMTRASTLESHLGRQSLQQLAKVRSTGADHQHTSQADFRRPDLTSDLAQLSALTSTADSKLPSTLQESLLQACGGGHAPVPTRMRVALRCRPLLQAELARNALPIIKCSSESVIVERYAQYVERKMFQFDHVYGPQASQQSFFLSEITPMLSLALKGFPCTVFAYGQTGTGKTFTLEGHHSSLGATIRQSPAVGKPLPQGAGVMPRTVKFLFDLADTADCTVRLKVGHLEIYKEQISDLLASYQLNGDQEPAAHSDTQSSSPTKNVISAPPPAARTSTYSAVSKLGTMALLSSASSQARPYTGNGDRKRAKRHSMISTPFSSPQMGAHAKIHDTFTMQGTNMGIPVSGTNTVVVTSLGEAFDLMKYSHSQRHTAGTLMNERSSRSHAIMSIEFTFTSAQDLADTHSGFMNLVDLSGSENIKRSGATDLRQQEASLINQGLLSLGRVIQGLAAKQSHVPYRESKLTRLLRPSLNGESACLMLLAVSPSSQDADETVATMNYANTAKQILVRPQPGPLGHSGYEVEARVSKKIGGTLDSGAQWAASSSSNIPIIPVAVHEFTAAGFNANHLMSVAKPEIRDAFAAGALHASSAATTVAVQTIFNLSEKAASAVEGSVARSSLLSAPVAVQPVKRQHECKLWVNRFILTPVRQTWAALQVVAPVQRVCLSQQAVQACLRVFSAFDSQGQACLFAKDMRELHAHVHRWAKENVANDEITRLSDAGGLHVPSFRALLQEAVLGIRTTSVSHSDKETIFKWVTGMQEADSFHYATGVDFLLKLLELAPDVFTSRVARSTVTQIREKPEFNDASKANSTLIRKLKKLAVQSVANFASGPPPLWQVPPVAQPTKLQPFAEQAPGLAVPVIAQAPLEHNVWWQGATEASTGGLPAVYVSQQHKDGSNSVSGSFWGRVQAPAPETIQAAMSKVVNERKQKLLDFVLQLGIHRRVRAALQAAAPAFGEGSVAAVRSTAVMPLPRFLAYIQHLAEHDPVSCQAFFKCFHFDTQADFDALVIGAAVSKGERMGRASAGVQVASPPKPTGAYDVKQATLVVGKRHKPWIRLRKLVQKHDARLEQAHRWLAQQLGQSVSGEALAYKQTLYQYHCMSGPFLRSYGGAEAAVRADVHLQAGFLKILGAPDTDFQAAGDAFWQMPTASKYEGLTCAEYCHLQANELTTLAHVASAELPLPAFPGSGPPGMASWVVLGQSHIAEVRRSIFERLKLAEVSLERQVHSSLQPAARHGSAVMASNAAGDSGEKAASSIGTTSTSPASS